MKTVFFFSIKFLFVAFVVGHFAGTSLSAEDCPCESFAWHISMYVKES